VTDAHVPAAVAGRRSRSIGSRLALLATLALLVVGALAVFGGSAGAQTAGTSRSQAVDQLQTVRTSIDQTLALLKDGKRQQALAQSRAGYLDHFEFVEIPLRLADSSLTLEAEQKFAEIRNSISGGDSTGTIRNQIIELRDLIDSAERKLTDPGLTAPLLVTSQSFIIIFREGLEAVLLLSALIGYLEAAKATQFRRPILIGVALAAVATVATVFVLQAVLSIAPASRDVLEAFVALFAVVMLVWVSFWLIARLEHKRWMEFLRSRVWTAVSLGSATSLILIGFTAVYREGFETVLFYQALADFGHGLGGWIALGFGLGVVALALVSWLIFRLGRRVPIKVFMTVAVSLVMLTSIAFLGNAVAELQSADRIPTTPLTGWPRMPIFLSEATGYHPTVQTVTAQAVLAAVYLLGALWVFVLQPVRARRRAGARPSAGGSAPAPERPAPAEIGS
jgi:high-affinity iron transporter